MTTSTSPTHRRSPMSPSEQFTLDPAQLHGHASTVGDVADQLSAIGGQLPGGPADLPPRPFAGFLSPRPGGAPTPGADTITGASPPLARPGTAPRRPPP